MGILAAIPSFPSGHDVVRYLVQNSILGPMLRRVQQRYNVTERLQECGVYAVRLHAQVYDTLLRGSCDTTNHNAGCCHCDDTLQGSERGPLVGQHAGPVYFHGSVAHQGDQKLSKTTR